MLCIFDLDGTLIDSLSDLAGACNAVLRARGLPEHEAAAYRYFVGDGVGKLIERMLPEQARTPQICRACREAFDTYYHDHCMDATAPYDGILPLLDMLAAQGVKTAVLSNKPDGFVRQICDTIFGAGRFSVVFGQRDGVPNKPDPAGILQVMRQTGELPENTVMIGDSGMDMAAAVRAKVRGIGAAWGFRTAEELRKSGAQDIADTPEQLERQLQTWIEKGNDNAVHRFI